MQARATTKLFTWLIVSNFQDQRFSDSRQTLLHRRRRLFDAFQRPWTQKFHRLLSKQHCSRPSQPTCLIFKLSFSDCSDFLSQIKSQRPRVDPIILSEPLLSTIKWKLLQPEQEAGNFKWALLDRYSKPSRCFTSLDWDSFLLWASTQRCSRLLVQLLVCKTSVKFQPKDILLCWIYIAVMFKF